MFVKFISDATSHLSVGLPMKHFSTIICIFWENVVIVDTNHCLNTPPSKPPGSDRGGEEEG